MGNGFAERCQTYQDMYQMGRDTNALHPGPESKEQ
ncbi:hypothetical protein Halar_1858 [halophilic archaeon DL31]|jgi:hypothetical protein|nr:hypothetical protein Halar_1858 [halophilic archaeon DL31]